MKTPKFLLPAAMCLSLLLASPAKAATVYALTDTGSLLTFDHLTPGTVTSVTIVGQGAYDLLAIDVRPTVQTTAPLNPGVGSLWAIGKSGVVFQLFVIDPTTGIATAIGAPLTGTINGAPGVNMWGFDFNPTVDRIRFVNSTAAGNNYRLNPNTGTLAAADTDLAFQAGDVNFGLVPTVDAAAYATAPFGGTTSLFYLDTNLDILVFSPNANLGSLQTIGSLGFDVGEPNGFDIVGGLSIFSVNGVLGPALYSVNLTTGTATLLGAFPTGTSVRGLAISTKPTVTITGSLRKVTRSTRVDVRFRAQDDLGPVVVGVRQTRRGSTFNTVSTGTPPVYSATLRRLEFGNNPVIVRAVDSSGQSTSVRLVVRRTR